MRNNRTQPREFWVAIFDTEAQARSAAYETWPGIWENEAHPGQWCVIIPAQWHASVSISTGFKGWWIPAVNE